MATECLARGPWFVKFIRGEKLRMGIIRKQYFGISAVAMAVIQIMLDIEWEDAEKPERARIVEIVASVLIGF